MWYIVDNDASIDSPALLFYPERIAGNIEKVKQMVGDPDQLRVHVKTNKCPEVCRMMKDRGITKFKCATIAEAEMLGQIGVVDVLLAYQPVGPKFLRLLKLIEAYPQTHYSCLVDNIFTANIISHTCESRGFQMDVFIDLNVGMNRTGIRCKDAVDLVSGICSLHGLRIAGFHAYDGHIHDRGLGLRIEKANWAYAEVEQLLEATRHLFATVPQVVAGGTPTFPAHLLRGDVECSPGTFVFWDWGYREQLPEQLFEYAALLLTRVISVIDSQTVCTDLGHKSVAAENPLPRVHFLNAPEAEPIAQSEEHLVVRVPDSSQFEVGTVLYGVPVHICPTVALYERAFIINNHSFTDVWKIEARDRYINC